MGKKRKIGIILGFIIILLVIILGVFWFADKGKREDAIVMNPMQNMQSATNCEINKEIEHISILTRPPRFGHYNLAFKLDVPVSWRTTQEKWDHIKHEYVTYNDDLAILNFLSPHTPHLEDSGLMPENYLSFSDITEWMKTDTNNFFNELVKSSDKKDYFDFLVNLRNRKQDADFSKCISLYRYNCRGTEKTYIESSDGVFSGFASIQTSPQAFQYDPTVFVYMTGNVAGKNIYINGKFQLYGDLNKQLAQGVGDYDTLTKNALEELNKNGLPSDSQSQYDQILDVMRTIEAEIVPE